jgi:hypothetical protein
MTKHLRSSSYPPEQLEILMTLRVGTRSLLKTYSRLLLWIISLGSIVATVHIILNAHNEPSDHDTEIIDKPQDDLHRDGATTAAPNVSELPAFGMFPEDLDDIYDSDRILEQIKFKPRNPKPGAVHWIYQAYNDAGKEDGWRAYLSGPM